MPRRCLLCPWEAAGSDDKKPVWGVRGLHAKSETQGWKEEGACPQSRGGLPPGARPCVLQSRQVDQAEVSRRATGSKLPPNHL